MTRLAFANGLAGGQIASTLGTAIGMKIQKIGMSINSVEFRHRTKDAARILAALAQRHGFPQVH